VGLIPVRMGTGFSIVTALLPFSEEFVWLMAWTVTVFGVGNCSGVM